MASWTATPGLDVIAGATSALAAATAACALLGVRRCRGSTLTAPLAWVAGCSGLLAIVELGGAVVGPAPQQPTLLRYLTIVGTFCPLVAVLGAKRPQDRAWQATVAALWVVLALPGLHAAAAQATPQLSGPWAAFAIVLCLMPCVCYGPTRRRVPAAFATLGHLSFVAPLVSEAAAPATGWWMLCGSWWCFLAAAATCWSAASAPRDEPPPDVAAHLSDADFAEFLERRWVRFCAGWGALWGLRLAARLNQTAELQQWPVRVGLQGFRAAEAERSAATRDASPAATRGQLDQIAAALDAVLWRFEPPAP